MNKLYLFFVFYLVCTQTGIANPDSRKHFIKKYKDIAIQEMDRTGIPASIKLAQGILESGCGRSELSLNANNHFGIKCHDWTGPSVKKDDDRRNECFRKYKSPEQSWIDHSNFLTTRSRYAFLFDLSKTDYKGWAKGLKKAGYATAPDYAQKLIRIIEEEKLYEFDRPGRNYKPLSYNADYSLRSSKYQQRVVYVNNRPCIKIQNGDSFEAIALDLGIPLKKLLAYNDKNETSICNGMHVFLKKKRNKAPR